MKVILLQLIKFYKRFFSPLFPASCRFHPTCSDYAASAIKEWGAARGSLLAAKRLTKCHPFHPGGFDSVPVNMKKSIK